MTQYKSADLVTGRNQNVMRLFTSDKRIMMLFIGFINLPEF